MTKEIAQGKTWAFFAIEERSNNVSEMKRIMIGEKTYPMKMDINVLEEIQEKYGLISEFERDILGLKLMKDADGKQIYDKNGDPAMYQGEPSIKAIKTALAPMINEGLAIEAEETGKELQKVTPNFVIRECHIPFHDLAEMIHREFATCFETKNQLPGE